MKQGVLTQGRVRLLLSKGHSCYRQRRTGERKRKSVRGCIVEGNLSVLSVIIVKKGDNEIPGLTDNTIPRRLAPKRKRAEKNRQAAAEYAKILAQRQKEAKEAKELRRKRSASLRESRNSTKSS